MLDINLKTINASEEEVIVKNHSFQDVGQAHELYDKLTEEYAEQSVPFFDNDEKIIKLELSKDGKDEWNLNVILNTVKNCCKAYITDSETVKDRDL